MVSTATAEVKLGGSQLLEKHTTKLWLRDEKKTNAVPYKQKWFLLPTEAQERDFQRPYFRKEESKPNRKVGQKSSKDRR